MDSQNDEDQVLLSSRAQSGWSIILDQSWGCVYAYLRNPDGRIISDCWLYNICSYSGDAVSPGESFTGQYRNFPPFAREDNCLDGQQIYQLIVKWSAADNAADIMLADRKIAAIDACERPGRSVFADEDSSIAKSLK